MCGKISFCLLVSLLLTVSLAAPHDHEDHSADHHQHLHHGKDEPHPSHDGDDDLSSRLTPHNADFAFSLYKKLAGLPDVQGKNIFFSPLSISMALSMLALGAKGETHSQIFSSLGYSALTPDQVNEGYEHLFHMLGHSQDTMLLEAGSAVAVREGFKPLDKFLKDAQHYYQGEAFSVDFSKPEVAVQEVNKYIAKKTKDMITDMVKELDPDTMMMLINYMYFRGKWKIPFKTGRTTKADFHVDEKTNVTVDMMGNTGFYKFYDDRSNFSSIIMVPYKGKASMMIVLPDEGKMQDVEKNINKEHLKYWCDRLQRSYVDLFMPKFSTSSAFSLADTMKEMGIVDAFSGTADFTGITEAKNMKVSKVLHQAVLRVDEKGTEAAAVTTIEITPDSFSPIVNLNKPFLVFIVEDSTRSILFMGKITNPTA
uniref:Serpin domain-containing protein n=1 Tax=Pygocentrus nattereri TaxID=42514 RepID=A0AAR2LUT4_PYGNA